MQNPFSIVKDSSIWQNEQAFDAVERKDPFLRIGIVKKVYRDASTSDLRYLVEIRDRSDAIELNCRMLRKFGGVFNYEDQVHRGYKIDDKPDPVASFDSKAGDAVLVGFLNGEAREAIIIGSLMHPARTSTIDITKGPVYQSEFNGIETSINESGEYTITFKAIPINIEKLNNTPASKLPAPQYNTSVGGSFFKFDKTGSFEINDKSQSNLQSIRIDKPAGTIELKSGAVSLKLTKGSEKTELVCKVLDVNAADKITKKTKEFAVDATTSAKIKSPKVAFGKDGVELLDQLSKLIDNLGKVMPISPVGPCTTLQASPEWSGVVQTQSKIKEITGSL